MSKGNWIVLVASLLVGFGMTFSEGRQTIRQVTLESYQDEAAELAATWLAANAARAELAVAETVLPETVIVASRPKPVAKARVAGGGCGAWRELVQGSGMVRSCEGGAL
jgi:hypothetical protein